MPRGLTSPITNFVSLADIDQAVQRTKAAEQQATLRDLQIKEAMQKQQDDMQLRDLVRSNTTQATQASQSPVSPDEQMGLENLRTLGGQNVDPTVSQVGDTYMRNTPGKPASVDWNAIATGAAGINPRMALSLQKDVQGVESGKLNLESGKTKQQIEDMTAAAHFASLGEDGWGKAMEIVAKTNPELASKLGEYTPEKAKKFQEVSLTEVQKETIAHQQRQDAASMVRANKSSSKLTSVRERLLLNDEMLDSGDITQNEWADRNKRIRSEGTERWKPSTGGFAENSAYIKWYKAKWPMTMGIPDPDAPPVDSPQAMQLWEKYKASSGTNSKTTIQPSPESTSMSSNQPIKISNEKEYAELPSGTVYIAPDGKARTKK